MDKDLVLWAILATIVLGALEVLLALAALLLKGIF